MLQLILGRAASGKTETVYRTLKARLAAGKSPVLLVPEQFSFESERALLRLLGQSASTGVPVLSFTRLVEEVGRQTGGIAAETVTDCDRVILTGKALTQLADDLPLWRRCATSAAFARTMAGTIRELKLNAVTPDDLRRTAAALPEGTLATKLTGFARVMDLYDTLLTDRFLDPDDDLTRLYDRLARCPYFAGKTVFLDAFKGFTGQQYRILDRILAQAEDVYLTLPTDPAPDDEVGLFSNVKAARRRVEALARAHGVPVAEPIVLHESHYESAGLTRLEAGLASDALPEARDGATDGVTLCAAETIYDEADFAAATIRRLVREEGYRYRDFVIIARDADRYAALIEDACARQDVPCFLDRRLPVDRLPLLMLADAALEAAASFSTEAVLRCLKTGLAGFDAAQVHTLENYVYLWNIDGKTWREDWTMDPDGFQSAGPDRPAAIAAPLADLNALRRRVVTPLTALGQALGGSPKKVCTAIWRFVETVGAADALRQMADEMQAAGDPDGADLQRRSWEVLTDLLDRLVVSLDDAATPPRRFLELWRLALSFITVGSLPQMLDEVTFGAADRIRPSRPKIAVVVGLNQGVFPQPAPAGGLLARQERARLIALGLSLPDRTVQTALDENLLVYTSLCCPSERLFLTYCRTDAAGNAVSPSPVVETVRAFLPGCREVTAPAAADLPETKAVAFARLAAGWRTPDALTASLRESLADDPVYAGRLRALANLSGQRPDVLSQASAIRLFGRDVTVSASRFDKFHKCHFSYFCAYGLRARTLQPASLDVLQRGTLVHAVLEALVRQYGKGLGDLTDDAVAAAVDAAADAYLASIPGVAQIETHRFCFLLREICKTIADIAKHLAAEFRQTAFEPSRCEWQIGPDEGLPSVTVPLADGCVRLRGSVDRVDTCGDYVRVIDYKTNAKEFDLADTLYGQNLQMLLYLYAAVRGSASEFAGAQPAGVLYMPAKRERTDVNNGHALRMNGVLLCDPAVVEAMEPENAGEFVPKLKINKDGALAKNNDSFLDAQDFEAIFRHIEHLLAEMGEALHAGDIAIDPLDGLHSKGCDYCEFAGVCGRENERARQVPKLAPSEVFRKMKEADENAV